MGAVSFMVDIGVCQRSPQTRYIISIVVDLCSVGIN